MKIEQQLACVHPMLYEHLVGESWIYSIGGTGFVVSSGANNYFITAHHCLKHSHATANQVSILSGSQSRSFLPFDAIYTARANDSEDQDYADFAVMRIKTDMMKIEDKLQLTGFSLTDQTVALPSDQFDAFVARGYPTELNVPDYETRLIQQHSFTFQPAFVGKAEEKHSYVFTWPNRNTIASPDGLSGAPVFGLRKLSGKKNTMSLVGMFIRGGTTRLRCIDAYVLWDTIKRHVT